MTNILEFSSFSQFAAFQYFILLLIEFWGVLVKQNKTFEYVTAQNRWWKNKQTALNYNKVQKNLQKKIST